MLVVVSDTHGRDDHCLVGRTRSAVEEAELVIHAGDFITERVLDAFQSVAASVHGVHGNRDEQGVRDRLPAALTTTYEGVQIAVTHRRRGGDTGLVMFGRERGADLVVHGHSHQPRVTDAGSVTLLNPGSHASPRGAPAAHAELEADGDSLRGTLLTVDGDVLEEFVC